MFDQLEREGWDDDEKVVKPSTDIDHEAGPSNGAAMDIDSDDDDFDGYLVSTKTDFP